ncbi:hypothetical protein FD755_016760 [Muntiacus reevesi]|uniref:Cryptic/Cripto CFC domain-containing protein n=1 Tax=Muntiacus reevesi TaxID=9886 RepID=A0A5N3XEZ7_MUNRE|nr:hypothetical protein FD755_016760 [Muntiacus reevesi]
MTWSHSVRLLFVISLILQTIPMGNSCHTGKYKISREESSSGKAQKFQQKTLNWTLNNLREENDSTEGWKPQGSFPYSLTFQELSGNIFPSAPPRPNCCQNGGTCVLKETGSRAAAAGPRGAGPGVRAPPALTPGLGFLSKCGGLVHGAWTFRGCHLCRCVFAALHCLPLQTPGRCDLKDFLTSHSNGPRTQLTWSVPLLLSCFLLKSILSEGGAC